jgi:hypothetical protein
MRPRRRLTFTGIGLIGLIAVIAVIVVVAAAAAVANAGAALGLRSRVLWRVPSPDGRLVAVCQEVPAIDGPGFRVRLERPDAARSVVKELYEIGDGDSCSELAWAPDSRTLAVLTGHVARIRFVDVAWAVDHATEPTQYWSWPEVSFSSGQHRVLGRDLRFTTPREVQLQVCSYDSTMSRGLAQPVCPAAPTMKQLTVPLR